MRLAGQYRKHFSCTCFVVIFQILNLLGLVSFSFAIEPDFSLKLNASVYAPGDVGWCSFSSPSPVGSAILVWKKDRIPLAYFEETKLFGAFFAIPHHEEPGENALDVEFLQVDGTRGRKNLIFKVVSKAFPVQRLSLPKEKVSLSKQNLERHSREKAAIKQALAYSPDARLWHQSFQRPVKGKISTPFGVRRVLNGQPRSPHSGIDLRGVLGEPVVASSDGVVMLTGDHFFAGKSVYVDHGMGLVTMYFHLSEIEVKPGERVRAGQTIGLMGSTGRSTGPHLHWGLRVHNRPADPLSLLALFPLP